MAIDPATAKMIAQAVISQITDEEKRQRLVIGIIIAIVVFLLIIMIPLFALTETIDNIKSFFGFGDNGEALDEDYNYLIEMREKYGYNLESEELIFNGTLPMPVNNAVVTSEFGSRIHPVTGAWRTNIMSVANGKIVFAGVKTGYGNCVQIEHVLEDGTKYYTLYAHLARIDVIEGQEVLQGNVIGTQGGDPKRDPNPRI